METIAVVREPVQGAKVRFTLTGFDQSAGPAFTHFRPLRTGRRPNSRSAWIWL